MPKPKDPAAQKLGRKGGKARAKNLTPTERSEAARKAAVARWGDSLKVLLKVNT